MRHREMMIMKFLCKGGCGKDMGLTTQLQTCDACRAKKSRAKRNAVPQAYQMGFDIDAWGKMLSEGVLSPEQGREIVNAVYDRIYELHTQVVRLEAVKAAKEAEKQAKKGRR